jgi:hypothetical protein
MRQSIINQGDIFINEMNRRKLITAAAFDD